MEEGDDRLTKINEQIAELDEQLKPHLPNDKEGSQAVQDAIGQKVGAGGWFSYTGFTMGTPVTDGEHIWVRYGTGVSACYDLDGNQKWFQYTGLHGTIGVVGSPILADGLFIQEAQLSRGFAKKRGIDRSAVEEQLPGVGSLRILMALDAETGEEKWHQFLRGGSGDYGGPYGPRGMRLPLPEGGHVDVVLAGANVFRASDGFLLHNATGVKPMYSGIVDGQKLYGESKVAQYWLENKDTLGVRHLFSFAGGSTNGAVRHGDNSIWTNPPSKLTGGRSRVDWNGVFATTADGQKLYERKTIVEHTGQAYVPPVSVGKDFIYLVDGGWEKKKHDGTGQIVVMDTRGPVPQPLARSFVEVTFTGPIFDNERMYLRSRNSLTCFAVTDDKGRKYEYAQSVKELFETRGKLPAIPPRQPIPELQAGLKEAPPLGVPVCKVYPIFAPDAYLTLGPLPRKTWKGKDALSGIGGASEAHPVLNQDIEIGEQQMQFTPIDDSVITVHSGLSKDMYDRTYFSQSGPMSMRKLTKGGDSVGYLYCVLETVRPMVVKYTNATGGIKTWVSGQAIKHNDSIRLLPGFHPMMMRYEIGRLPPMAKKIALKPRFVEVEDPHKQLIQWYKEVIPYKERLETITKRMEGTPYAIQAQLILRSLEEGGRLITN